jgi:hypothetical protein
MLQMESELVGGSITFQNLKIGVSLSQAHPEQLQSDGLDVDEPVSDKRKEDVVLESPTAAFLTTPAIQTGFASPTTELGHGVTMAAEVLVPSTDHPTMTAESAALTFPVDPVENSHPMGGTKPLEEDMEVDKDSDSDSPIPNIVLDSDSDEE